jgi:hypothetical protein
VDSAPHLQKYFKTSLVFPSILWEMGSFSTHTISFPFQVTRLYHNRPWLGVP